MIPGRLAHLHTWRGLPVPFINIWSDEQDEHAMAPAYDITARGEAWFSAGRQGVGDPDFTRQCPQRQRLVTFFGLCQVCLAPVGPVRNVLRMGEKARRVDGTGRLLIGEPWICDDCVYYARATCPGIRSHAPEVLRLTRWRLHKEVSWHDDYGPDVTATMWIQIEPLEAIIRGRRHEIRLSQDALA